jgi:hypothetical protein
MPGNLSLTSGEKPLDPGRHCEERSEAPFDGSGILPVSADRRDPSPTELRSLRSCALAMTATTPALASA